MTDYQLPKGASNGDFTYSKKTPFFPPSGAAWTLPFFFFAVPQVRMNVNFSAEGRIDGRVYRGEELLWKLLFRAAHDDPSFFQPPSQKSMTIERLKKNLTDDAGVNAGDLDRRLDLARGLGEALAAQSWTPKIILDKALAASAPPDALRDLLLKLPGYGAAAAFLADILARRPEKFLP